MRMATFFYFFIFFDRGFGIEVDCSSSIVLMAEASICCSSGAMSPLLYIFFQLLVNNWQRTWHTLHCTKRVHCCQWLIWCWITSQTHQARILLQEVCWWALLIPLTKTLNQHYSHPPEVPLMSRHLPQTPHWFPDLPQVLIMVRNVIVSTCSPNTTGAGIQTLNLLAKQVRKVKVMMTTPPSPQVLYVWTNSLSTKKKNLNKVEWRVN